jgi:hypothetical protein
MDNEVRNKEPKELLIGAKYTIHLKKGRTKEMFFCEVKPISWVNKDSEKLYFFSDKPMKNWLGYHYGTMIKYCNIGEMVALAYHEEYLKQKENSKQSAMARAAAMGKTIYAR